MKPKKEVTQYDLENLVQEINQLKTKDNGKN